MARLPLMMPVGRTGRKVRAPKHTWQVNHKAFIIQPIMIAPVLPGETLENVFFESRVVSDPVLNKLIGWKHEYAFYYVKISDLLTSAIRDMFIDPTNTDLTASLGEAANVQAFYTAKGSIDYAERCYQRIVTEYFRDEGEDHTDFTLDGLCIAQIRDTFWMDTLTDKDDMPEGAAIAGATDAGDLDRLLDAFEQLRSLGLANMTYEDFLRSYGIAIPNKDEDKPELLCRFADFQYPTNTVEPTTGVPTSALSWVFKNGDSNNKRGWFCKEPGFIFGVSITRPKVYFAGLAGNLAGFMGRAWDWMPNYLRSMPETSLKNFATDTGPLGDRTTAPDGYWVDMNDLLLYGDQFHNIQAFPAVPAAVGANHLVALPTGDTFNFKYPTQTDLESFFAGTAANGRVRQDGYASLTIKGMQSENTPMNFATA